LFLEHIYLPFSIFDTLTITLSKQICKKLLSTAEMVKKMPETHSPAQRCEAEVIDLEILVERKVSKPCRPVGRTQEQKEKESPFQTLITVHLSLNNFPVALCEWLQKACRSAFHKHMPALEAGTMPEHHQIYCIFTGTRVRSNSTAFETTVAIANILKLSMANATLLQYFLEKTNVGLSKKTFVASETVEGITNPEILELYSVRKGMPMGAYRAYPSMRPGLLARNLERGSDMSRVAWSKLRIRIKRVQDGLVEGVG